MIKRRLGLVLLRLKGFFSCHCGLNFPLFVFFETGYYMNAGVYLLFLGICLGFLFPIGIFWAFFLSVVIFVDLRLLG